MFTDRYHRFIPGPAEIHTNKVLFYNKMKSIALYYSTKYQQEETPVDTNKETMPNEELIKEGEANGSDMKDESKNDLKTEFHVNIWKVEEGTYKLSPRFYFDFGVMFPKEYKALCLYLPFEIEGTPEDLSGYLTGNQSTLSAVFNADTRTWAHYNPNYFNVTFVGGDKKFYFYKLGSSNFEKTNFSKEDPKLGFFLKIFINGDVDKDKGKNDIDADLKYVRFRVMLAKDSSFIRTEQISNDLLQAAFSSTDLIDVRINESRVLDTKIRERMEQKDFEPFEFDKIHLFYMVDTRENVDNGSSLKQDTRIVEQEQWGDYIPKTSLHNTTFVAYHWKKRRKYIDEINKKKEDPIKTFNVFFSTIYPKTNIKRLAAYTFVVVVLGFIGSMLSFRLNQLTYDWWQSLLRPAIIVMMLLFVAGYFIKQNFGGKGFEIFRKR